MSASSGDPPAPYQNLREDATLAHPQFLKMPYFFSLAPVKGEREG